MKLRGKYAKITALYRRRCRRDLLLRDPRGRQPIRILRYYLFNILNAEIYRAFACRYLLSVRVDRVVIRVDQLLDRHELEPLRFQRFQNIGQRFRCIFQIVVEQQYRPGFNVFQNPLLDLIRRRLLPVYAVAARYRWETALLPRFSI